MSFKIGDELIWMGNVYFITHIFDYHYGVDSHDSVNKSDPARVDKKWLETNCRKLTKLDKALK